MSTVSETLLAYLPGQRKTTPSGWIKFNSPCCHHNGESLDTKQRGGLVENGDIISYHCFNCGYKASWQPGRNMSFKLRCLLEWFGVPDSEITKVSLAVLRENEGVEAGVRIAALPVFNEVPLLNGALPLSELIDSDAVDSKHFLRILEYMQERSLYLDDYNFYWTPSLGYRDRLILPYNNENKIVGWTARSVTGKKPKYLSEQQVGYVFNLDEQTHDKAFCIVVEGPIDAIQIGGVALLGSDIKDEQAMLINRLHKRIILVPDRDDAGKKLIQTAIDNSWSVSFPLWEDDITDVSEAVDRYGKLYTLHSIVDGASDSELKIQLSAKRWFR